MNVLNRLKNEIHALGNPQKAQQFKRFFKTGKGEYGEGDEFEGLTVPQCRMLVSAYSFVSFREITEHIRSKIHEERLIALLILVEQYHTAQKKNSRKLQKQIYGFYLAHTQNINNWDLVDLSSPHIVGNYLLLYPAKRKILYRLARSTNIWERRIAVVSTYAFIKNNDCEDIYRIAELLLSDSHDLIHKAVGWMLREAGKQCGTDRLINFIHSHYANIPRTTLRYAIERFPEPQRRNLLHGNFI